MLVASLLSVAPAVSSHAGIGQLAGIGAVEGAGTGPRIAIAGLNAPEPAIGAVGDASGSSSSEATDATAFGAGDIASSGPAAAPGAAASLDAAARVDAATSDSGIAQQSGPFLEDGTLLKPLAVDTTVPDGSSQLKSYVVRSGDTLTGIANRFGISMMTIWWANDLRAKDELHVGQKLVIPPVSGVVVEVTPGDTLESIAADAGVSPDVIVNYNHLTDRTVIIGQTLIVPGGVGDPIPTPTTPTPTTRSGSSGSSGGSSSGSSGSSGSTRPSTPPRSYTGGRFTWPVVGGGNYISQYFHYSHQAIDIAADYGSPVVAAASGTVIFAGWKNNGGGWQVWISHGNNLYTDYNHMSALTVGTGQQVAAGQQVGRIGATGDATGPHLHFDVWIGMIWGSGSYRVNPLRYY